MKNWVIYVICFLIGWLFANTMGDGFTSNECIETLDNVCPTITNICRTCSGLNQHPLRAAGCTPSDINDYCSRSAGCNQTFFSTNNNMSLINSMKTKLETAKPKREINIIGYLGGGPWTINSVLILPQIDKIKYYNTIILCFANFTGTKDNPVIMVSGAYLLSDGRGINPGKLGWPLPSNNNLDKCIDCKEGSDADGGVPLEDGICTKYCSKNGYCGTTPIYSTDGTNCSDSRCYKCNLCNTTDPNKICTEYCSKWNWCGSDPEHKTGGINCSGCKEMENNKKYGNIEDDTDTYEFIKLIKLWKTEPKENYKGPQRKVLITFGGSSNFFPEHLLNGDPTKQGTYTYNLLKPQSELGGKSILLSFLETWDLDGIDLDYEFPGNMSGNPDDHKLTGVKNNWRAIITHLKLNNKIVYATPYGNHGALQQQYNYLLNEKYMGQYTIDVMQHQMYNGGVPYGVDQKWFKYLKDEMNSMIPYNSNIDLKNYGCIFTNNPLDESSNCWDVGQFMLDIINTINKEDSYVTNFGVWLLDYDYYYGYYFGRLLDSIR